jgi:hypothetical protein
MSRVLLSRVDLLARLRRSTAVRVVAAPDELWELIDLCGLRDVLAADAVREQKSGPHAARRGCCSNAREAGRSLR